MKNEPCWLEKNNTNSAIRVVEDVRMSVVFCKTERFWGIMDQRPKIQIPAVDSLRNMVSHPKFKKEKNVARRECIEFLQGEARWT